MKCACRLRRWVARLPVATSSPARVCRFNKRREDFDSLEAYNEYLEMVEEKGAWCKASAVNQTGHTATCPTPRCTADALRSGGDKEAVEAALAQYKSLHAREINLATEAARRRREMEQVQAKHDIALRLQRAAAANPKDAYAQEAAEAAAAAARAASHSAAAPGSHAGQGVAGPTLEAVHLRPLPRRAAPELGPVVADPAVRAERFWVQHRGGKIPPGISRRKLEASVQGATKLAGGLDAAAVKERLLRDTMAGL